MNLRFQMVDTETGEIIATSYQHYALNFNTKKDAGFMFIMRWVQSAVRGVRTTEHKAIEVKIFMMEEQNSLMLPFPPSIEEQKAQAAQYVY